MKFKSLLLAAAGLFALADATSTTSPQGLDSVAIAGPDPAQCEKSCHVPWVKCVAEKGGDSYAEWWCNCKLFGNPNMYCRHSGCVQDPGECKNPQKARDMIAGRAPTELAPASTNVDPAQCDKYCHQPWLDCVAEHGGGPDAERGCNCALFYNPDLFCRHAGCVQPPQGCNKKAEAVDVVVPITTSAPVVPRATNDSCYENCQVPWDKCMTTCDADERWFCEIICNCRLFQDADGCCRVNECVKVPTNCPGRKRELSSASLDARSEDLVKKDDEPAAGSVAIAPPPGNPCVACQFAINTCEDECGTPGGLCAPACQCWEKRNNQNCKDCKLNLNCDEKQSSEVFSEELVKKDDEPATGPVAIAPPPGNPCVACQYAINACGKDCATKGACDATCNFYHKMYNRSCKECKIKCDCGHVCPRPALKQRRTEVSAQDFEDISPAENVVARAPNPCVICENSIKICKKPCNGDAGCENNCNCKWKKNLNCKECRVPCNS